jgi:hypothetical protein
LALTVVELQALGFFEAGTCMLDQGLMSGVRFHVAVSKDARVIYAFAVDDQVKYIGVCDNSGTCLGHRMSRYQGMMGASTNERIAVEIHNALSEGASVRIFAWRPEQQLKVGELSIDLIKGLENPLIALAKPEWNIHG